MHQTKLLCCKEKRNTITQWLLGFTAMKTINQCQLTIPACEHADRSVVFTYLQVAKFEGEPHTYQMFNWKATKFVRSCPLRVFCSCYDFRQDTEYFGYWLKQFIYPYNVSMFYISLHAVLTMLMLQIYRTGVPFIYILRFVGDRLDKGNVERS